MRGPATRALAAAAASRGCRRAAPLRRCRRDYNFASAAYNAAFAGQPTPDGARLRAETLRYLEGFDPRRWHDDPVATVVGGAVHAGGAAQDTVDAFGRPNGRQLLATADEMAAVRDHLASWAPPERDYRDAVRRIEQVLLGEKAGAIIGNQAVDFSKQARLPPCRPPAPPPTHARCLRPDAGWGRAGRRDGDRGVGGGEPRRAQPE